MKNCFRSRRTGFFLLATFAAIGLACSASTSRADITKMLQQGEPGKVSTPREVLPAIINPQPFRQGLYVKCNENNPLTGPNACIMSFDVVPVGHVMQIDRVNCISPAAGTAFIFNTEIKFNGNRIAGFVLPPYQGPTGGVATGPYYFRAKERPLIVATGSASTDTALCTISGTLWQTSK